MLEVVYLFRGEFETTWEFDKEERYSYSFSD